MAIFAQGVNVYLGHWALAILDQYAKEKPQTKPPGSSARTLWLRSAGLEEYRDFLERVREYYYCTGDRLEAEQHDLMLKLLAVSTVAVMREDVHQCDTFVGAHGQLRHGQLRLSEFLIHFIKCEAHDVHLGHRVELRMAKMFRQLCRQELGGPAESNLCLRCSECARCDAARRSSMPQVGVAELPPVLPATRGSPMSNLRRRLSCTAADCREAGRGRRTE